uniref:Uncharacterized protein n=1 Tax=Rhizophora mucronata TaxID=61149 RepID=A0A2P2P6Z2_RHIMU
MKDDFIVQASIRPSDSLCSKSDLAKISDRA